MKCLRCGRDMVASEGEFDYSACGLPVVLVGIPLHRCTCGNVEATVPNIEGLHALLAKDVAAEQRPLAGAEARFLREWLELGLEEWADSQRVGVATADAWERGALPVPPNVDALLRLLARSRDAREWLLKARPRTVGPAVRELPRRRFSGGKSGWKTAA